MKLEKKEFQSKLYHIQIKKNNAYKEHKQTKEVGNRNLEHIQIYQYRIGF